MELMFKVNINLQKINPLRTILGEELQTIIAESDVLTLTEENKNNIRRHFRQWSKTHHPDKWVCSSLDSTEKTIAYFIYQTFADPIIKCNEEEYDQVCFFFRIFSTDISRAVIRKYEYK